MDIAITVIVLAAILGAVAYWHLRENQATITQIPDLPELDKLIVEKALKQRTIHLLAVGIVMTCIIAGLQYKQSEAIDALAQLTSAVEKRNRIEAAKAQEAALAAQKAASETASIASMSSKDLLAAAPPPPPSPSPISPSAAAAPSPVAAPVVISPPAASPISPSSSLAAPQPAAAQQPAPSLSQALTQTQPTDNATPAEPVNLIEQVYNPERNPEDTSAQSAMDDIKKRYEDILVLHLFMSKCSFAQPADYSIITSALAKEIAAINAPGRLHSDVIETAKASFSELYAQSACDGESISGLRQQYTDYIQGLQNNFVGNSSTTP